MNKKIIFFVDSVHDMEMFKDVIPTSTVYCYSHKHTLEAIAADEPVICTMSLADLSFDWIKKGYKIYVVANGITKEFYPGMESAGGKDIREGHNLLRLFLGGYFNPDFYN